MQEEPWFAGDPPGAVWRQAAAGDDHVDVRVVCQRRSPGMKDAGHTHPRAHALGVGRDGHDGLGRRLEQQAIDRLLVPIGDLRDFGWHREDDVEVFHRQQVLSPCLHPVARRRPLTLRTVPVLAGVVGNVMVATLGTARHMPAERLGPAGLDG